MAPESRLNGELVYEYDVFMSYSVGLSATIVLRYCAAFWFLYE